MDDLLRQHLSEGEQAGARYCLAMPRHAPMGTAGAQLGRLAGASMEFMDHREYQPGDDLRRMDWAAYARSDRLIVKLYRQEVCPHVDVVLDGSRSMALEGTAKRRAAAGLAAALACAAANSGYTHAAYIARAGCEAVVNGAGRPIAWDGLEFDSTRSVAEAFALMPPAWRPRGIRVLISDLLWMGEPRETLTALADRAAMVLVIQVLAKADVEPPPRGNLRLIDSESGAAEEFFIDATSERRYQDSLQRHQQNWQLAARQVGAVMLSLTAETLCQGWDLSDLVAAEILTT